MKFADHLSADDIQKFNQLRKAMRKNNVDGFRPDIVIYDETYERPVKSKKENFSRRELIDLMDVNRNVYKRVNGAWRRK